MKHIQFWIHFRGEGKVLERSKKSCLRGSEPPVIDSIHAEARETVSWVLSSGS